MGVKPHMLAPAVNCIIGQRLVRTLADDKKPVTITPEIQAELDRELTTVKQYRPELIPTAPLLYSSIALETGYRSRTCIAEVLTVDDDVESMILRGVSTLEILESIRPK
jgi:type II secretory ATPase GspE/PulE/Tfp pilus assembly ATPase PilB-like protein